MPASALRTTHGSPFQVLAGDPGDPYAPPQPLAGDVSIADPESGTVIVTEPMRRELAATRPWVLFMAVVMWLACGLIAMASFFVFMAALMSLSRNQAPGAEILVIVFYPVMAALYGVFAWLLQQYAGNLGAFGRSNRGEELLAALRSQKSFWRLAGIIVIAYLCLIVVVFIGAILWAVLSM
ncbi:MAG: hypothetical protein K2Y37_15115 [Pirellulales bacterium]|nr:hypothetical protein [Pirellulales bacterium]